MEFEGQDNAGRPVRFEAEWTKASGNVLSGSVRLLDNSIGDLSEIPRKQMLIGWFSPTDLAVPEVLFPVQYWTGEIKSDRDEEKHPPFAYHIELGTCEFSQTVKYEKILVGGQKADVLIPLATMVVKIPPSQLTSDLRTLIFDISSANRSL